MDTNMLVSVTGNTHVGEGGGGNTSKVVQIIPRQVGSIIVENRL